MAATLHTTIRLDVEVGGVVANCPDNEYKVLFEGAEDIFGPAVSVERSITGKLHVHRLMDGSNPVVFDDHHFTLKLTRAELVTLTADVGRTMYFMPHYRDEGAAWATYRFIVLLESMTGVRGINAMQEHFLATIYLRDNSDGSV